MKRRDFPAAALCVLMMLAGCAKQSSAAPSQAASVQAVDAPQSVSQVESAPSAAAPALRSEPYAALLAAKTYYLDCTVLLEVEGLRLSNRMVVAVRGDDYSVTVTGEMGGTPATLLRVLALDGQVYLVDDEKRTYAPAGESAAAGGFDTDFSRLVYRASGEGAFDGATLAYEEYAEGDGTLRFYFDKDTLAGVTRSIQDSMISEITLKIRGLSSNIPEGTLQIPPGYLLRETA